MKVTYPEVLYLNLHPPYNHSIPGYVPPILPYLIYLPLYLPFSPLSTLRLLKFPFTHPLSPSIFIVHLHYPCLSLSLPSILPPLSRTHTHARTRARACKHSLSNLSFSILWFSLHYFVRWHHLVTWQTACNQNEAHHYSLVMILIPQPTRVKGQSHRHLVMLVYSFHLHHQSHLVLLKRSVRAHILIHHVIPVFIF